MGSSIKYVRTKGGGGGGVLPKASRKRKHSNRTCELSNFGSLTQESELSGHEILVRLSESPTYPRSDLSEDF